MPDDPFRSFVHIIKRLRDPVGGCPWDLKQTHNSLTPYLIEEAYEVLEAIDDGDDKELCSELGDVLLQVVLHAQVASDRNAFTIDDVIRAVSEKMVRRHPHVFSDTHVNDANDVIRNWEEIKKEERKESGSERSTFGGIPKALPALHRAQRLGDRASQLSFDWLSTDGVWGKVKEEISELEDEMAKPISEQNKKDIQHELGDCLFSLCQLARWLELSAEESLHLGCKRFIERFEKMAAFSEAPLEKLSTDELEALWEKAKKQNKEVLP